MAEIVRFRFPQDSWPVAVQEDICLAIFMAECIHGRSQAKLDAGYLLAEDGRSCVMAIDGPAGETATRVLVGLFNERYGEEGYEVEREARP